LLGNVGRELRLWGVPLELVDLVGFIILHPNFTRLPINIASRASAGFVYGRPEGTKVRGLGFARRNEEDWTFCEEEWNFAKRRRSWCEWRSGVE
jgi:hypothetical protein